MTRDRASDPAPTDSVDDLLARWWTELAAALGLPAVDIDHDVLLALAGEAAHGVVRPAAPLTTFLVGYAAGLAGGGGDELRRAVATASEAVRERGRSA